MNFCPDLLFLRTKREFRFMASGSDVFEDMPEASVRLQAISLGRLDQAVASRAGACATRRVGKQPVLPIAKGRIAFSASALLMCR